MKYRTLAAALLLGSVMFTSCVDEFSELNSDPSTITKPDIRFLFTKCEASFQPGDYAQWFGGFNDLSTWSQTTVSSGGNTTRSNRPTDEANGCGYEVNEVLMRFDIKSACCLKRKKRLMNTSNIFVILCWFT